MFNRLTLIALLATAAPALADTAYVNANGYTIDDKGAVARFATLIVDDRGRVKATLPAGAPVPVKKTIDVGGRTLMPGLIDAHGHVMMLGELALRVDLNGTQSLGAAQAAIKAYKSSGPWILGGGWNQERWTSDGKAFGRFPTAAELDAVTGSKPAYLERVDGHAAWVNTRALQLAGITAGDQGPGRWPHRARRQRRADRRARRCGDGPGARQDPAGDARAGRQGAGDGARHHGVGRPDQRRTTPASIPTPGRAIAALPGRAS